MTQTSVEGRRDPADRREGIFRSPVVGTPTRESRSYGHTRSHTMIRFGVTIDVLILAGLAFMGLLR
ncbi:MAG: hypothetical protein R3223_11760 [Longimicrobiales bacterium]|nr:hypothetical protein [Longimicrobiales bacterium]